MQDHFAITISDGYRSRYYSVKKAFKRNLILGTCAFFLVLAASMGVNYLLYGEGQTLSQLNSQLDKELIRFDSENSHLNKIINKDKQVIENISEELVQIEKISGVDSGDQVLEIEERMRMIADFYGQKEIEFSQIGNRVQKIEGLIGLSGESKEHENLVARVEFASLTASHEKILHDSIPNGFPTDVEIVTSKFGDRIHPISKIKSFHKGVDLRSKVKDKIVVTADGIVSKANYSELSGKRLVVQHNFGFETRYSHLDGMLVEAGDVVHRGDLIGYSGNTGRSDAPHLHYEIRYLGKSIDPYQFLNWEFGSHEIFNKVTGIKWPSLISLINKQITHQTLQLSQLEPISSVR